MAQIIHYKDMKMMRTQDRNDCWYW